MKGVTIRGFGGAAAGLALLTAVSAEAQSPSPPRLSVQDSQCTKEVRHQAQVTCDAFHDGINQVWRDAPSKKRAPDGFSQPLTFADWRKAPGHLRYRSDHRYVLFYTSDGKPFEPLPQVDEDDTIVIVVVAAGLEGGADKAPKIEAVTVTTCNAPVPFRIAGSGKPSPTFAMKTMQNRSTPQAADPTTDYYKLVLTTRCRQEDGIEASATVKPTGENATPQTQALTKIPTLAVYNFTLGLGFLYDFTRTTEYRASTVKGQNVPVIVEDEHAEGMTPGVLFVSWRPWAVDTQRSRWPGGSTRASIGEWFGLSLGFRLTDPLHHLYTGVLVEPYPGFALTGGAHFQAVNSLGGGYKVGDRFSGGGDVPVDKRWDAKATSGYFGLVLDASVFAKLFSLFN